MKKVLEIKEVEPRILRIKLEATKKRAFLIKLLEKSESNVHGCCRYCSMKEICTKIPSPLINYNWNDFCCSLFMLYPELEQRLKKGWGIDSVVQVVMWERKRENH